MDSNTPVYTRFPVTIHPAGLAPRVSVKYDAGNDDAAAFSWTNDERSNPLEKHHLLKVRVFYLLDRDEAAGFLRLVVTED